MNNPINRSDPTGEFSPLLAAGLIGGIVGGIAQIVTNTLTGNKWYDGVAGAFVGGFTYAAVSVISPGNTVAASYAAAGAEAVVNEIVSYKKEGKPLSRDSLALSALTVLGKTATNGSLYMMAGKAADKIKINWGNLSNTAHYFIRRDAPAIITQSCYQAALVLGEKLALDSMLSPSVSKPLLS